MHLFLMHGIITTDEHAVKGLLECHRLDHEDITKGTDDKRGIRHAHIDPQPPAWKWD